MIRVSRMTDYAIVLLAHLARSERTLTGHELAELSSVPLPTVSKLCKELSKAGLVISHRGRKGGYGLARSADRISLAQIVEALEGPIALTECTHAAQSCELEATCVARASWSPVSQAIHGALSSLPLSSIAPPPPRGAAPVEPAASPRAPALVTLGVRS